jgi:hypothetical protein
MEAAVAMDALPRTLSPPRERLSGRPSFSGAEAFRVTLGVVLLLSAVLKGYDLAFDWQRAGSVVFAPPVQAAVVQIEVILGLLLLTKLVRHLAWVAAVAFFLIAACANLYLAGEGQPHCPCFGRFLSVSPWIAFAVDLLLMGGLVVWRPTDMGVHPHPTWLHRATRLILHRSKRLLAYPRIMVAVVFLGSAGITITAFYFFKQDDTDAREIAGLYVRKGVIDLGLLTQGESRTATFELLNKSSRPITIVNIATECICTKPDLQRNEIPAGTALSIPFQLNSRRLARAQGAEETPFRSGIIVDLQNDKDKRLFRLPLLITGRLDSQTCFSVIPSFINFGNVPDGGRGMSRTLQFQGPPAVLNSLPKQVTVDSGQPKALTLYYQGKDVGSGIRTMLLHLRLQDRALGHFSTSLSITLHGSRSYHQLVVPVVGSYRTLASSEASFSQVPQ